MNWDGAKKSVDGIIDTLGKIPNDIHAAYILALGTILYLKGNHDIGQGMVMTALGIFKGTGGGGPKPA